ncbi:hypothetical protein G9A89_003490 [Geosiphon pyriformis]|nr:hypothetical protein G9A89_003490 [Geosiphon pyriformis]
MARCANMAYCYPSAPGTIGSETTYVNTVMNIKGNEVIMYFHAPDLSIEEWVNRIPRLTKYEELDGAYVEHSWYHDVREMIEPLFNLLRKSIDTLKMKRVRFYFTGHAIGGAYAVLTALMIKEAFFALNQEDSEIQNFEFTAVTFGQPRIGNAAFAKYVNRVLEVYRVTHSNDFMPSYLESFRRDYDLSHHEMELWIVPKNCECPDSNLNQFNSLYNLFKCPGYSYVNVGAGENRECNSGTDGRGTSVHFGPYFNTTFKDCREFLSRAWSQTN